MLLLLMQLLNKGLNIYFSLMQQKYYEKHTTLEVLRFGTQTIVYTRQQVDWERAVGDIYVYI